MDKFNLTSVKSLLDVFVLLVLSTFATPAIVEVCLKCGA